MDTGSRPSPVRLTSGHLVPAVGLGTFQGSYDYTSTFDTVVSSVKSAIKCGYRHFDTAYIYDTEAGVGHAVKEMIAEGAICRQDVFVTTKLWCTDHRKENVVPALRKSLKILDLDYVDLYLVHWPIAMPPGEDIFPKGPNGELLYEDERTDIRETWHGMEACVRLGLARSIGMSNFNRRQLQKILDSCSIPPVMNQVECHPYFANDRLVKFCQDNDIVVSCFSPLSKPQRSWATKDDPIVFKDPILNEIGNRHKKSAAQVALRFQIQRGLVVVPKSNDPCRQKENLDIFDFELSPDEMDRIFTCDRNLRVLYLTNLKGSSEYPFTDEY